MLTLEQMPQALIAGSKQLRFYTRIAGGRAFPFSRPRLPPPPPWPSQPAAPKPQRAHKAQVSAVLTHAALLRPGQDHPEGPEGGPLLLAISRRSREQLGLGQALELCDRQEENENERADCTVREFRTAVRIHPSVFFFACFISICFK